MPSRFSSFRFSPLLKRQSSSSSPSRRTVEKESRESSSSEERKDRRERRGRRAGAGGDFEGEEEEEELVAGVGVPERSGKGGPRHARKKVSSSNSNKNNKNNSSSNSSSSCSVNDEDDGDKKKKKKKSAHNTKSKTKKKQSAKQVKKGIGRRRGTQGGVETGDVAKKNRRLSLKLASKKKGGGVGGQHDRVHAELDELYDSAELDEEEANLGSHDSSDGGFYSDSYSDAFVGSFDLVDDNHDGSSDFAILSPVEIAQEQRREVTKVAETLSVSRDDATALLKHFRWKREQLLTAYFEDPESVRTDAGVTGDIVFVEASRSNISATSSQSTLSSPRSSVDDGDDDEGHHHHHHGPDLSVLKQRVAGEGSSASTLGAVSGAVLLVGEEECSICGDEMPAEECTALICQHRFCNDCWEGYLNVKIREGETTLLCPAENCRLACDEDTVRKLLEPDVFDRYIEFLTKSFVDDNVGTIKWCPAPNCGNAITSDLVSGQVVRCTCGFRFCFSCHKEAHAPASCDQVKVWEKKCEDDSETDHWKIANTKECPKNGCQVSTEKNGGCNHMTCRQCKHEWCWVCMRPWKGHNDYYNCNKFTKDEAKAASATTKFGIFGRKSKQAKRLEREAEREATRVELERYLHFYERFANHSHSRDLEQQIRSRAVGKIDELAEAASQAELQYIEDGTDVLLECRNVLKYTYVFAYFLPVEGPEKELFEYLQEDLEKTTESLSEILEHPDGSQVYRLRAVNMIQLARTRVSNLLRGVEQGLTEVSEH